MMKTTCQVIVIITCIIAIPFTLAFKMAIGLLLLMLLAWMSSQGETAAVLDQASSNPLPCILANCSKVAGLCAIDSDCRKTIECNSKCLSAVNEDACNLLCELNYGYNSTRYREMMQCMGTHHCLPKTKPDGECLATDNDTVRNLTSMQQLKGKWWILKGLNCGQEGWPAGFDNFPCQREEYVQEGSQWVDHVAYCGGSNNTCSTPLIRNIANVSIASPGVISLKYLDVPLLPQNEHWRVLSWPHPDWVMYVYCGETPAGLYAGGGVISNSTRSIADIPPYVEHIFSSVAQKFKFSYEKMCLHDSTKCGD